MKTILAVRALACFLFCGQTVIWAWATEDERIKFFEQEDMIDRTTRKLKPVREVIETKDNDLELHHIRDCGPDDVQNWYEPDPEDCSCYFACTGRYYILRRCPTGLCFDMNDHQCKWPEEVDCGDREPPFTPEVYEGSAHHQFIIDQFTNSKDVHQPFKDRWLHFDKSETYDDEYEFFM